MKLSDEEIKEQADNQPGGEFGAAGFRAGARFAESRLLPFVEANDWLLIDTPEKKKACEPKLPTDECWAYRGGKWGAVETVHTEFTPTDIYRRAIRWHKVSETPIPKGVPVWLKFEHSERPLVHATGGIMSHESWGPITHWRYAVIPTPPQIDHEREAFEKWYAEAGSPMESIRKERLFECWQAARKAQ